mgnify:CR=1 FL=1
MAKCVMLDGHSHDRHIQCIALCAVAVAKDEVPVFAVSKRK